MVIALEEDFKIADLTNGKLMRRLWQLSEGIPETEEGLKHKASTDKKGKRKAPKIEKIDRLIMFPMKDKTLDVEQGGVR